MRHKALSLLCVAALALASCSSSGEGDDTDGDPRSNGSASSNGDTGAPNPTADPAEDPAALVRESVDATLAVKTFHIESDLSLSVDLMSLLLTVEGPVDYESLIADVELVVQSGGDGGRINVRSDGETLWVAAEGSAVPDLPGGSSWVEGSVALLEESESFGTEGLLGTIYALRAAEDVEVAGEEDVDGVATTHLTTSFTYAAAVEAAGPDSDAFAESFSLTGFDHAVIEVEVWIGDDGVIRRLSYALDESDPGNLDGSYDLTLSAVNEPVDLPDAPDADLISTGPEAEAWLEANIS